MLEDGRLLGSRDDVIGGQPAGVYIRPANYEKFTRRVVMELSSTREEQLSFYGFLHSQIGKPYDKTAIWAFMVNRDWRDKDSWFCSELQTAALEHAGLVRRLYLVANKVTPVACALVMSAIGARDRHFPAAA